MANQTHDKRAARTKMLIRGALTELMEEKGFEGVTVRDLTEKAQINRGTFYLHYRDKYDLLEQSEEEILKEIKDNASGINPKDALHSTSQDEPFPVILKLFEYFQENAQFMRVVLGPKGDASFQVKLKELIKQQFFQNIASKLNSEDMLVPAEYLIAFVSSAQLGLIQHWLETGMKKPPEEMALIAAKMILLGPGHVAGIKN